LEQEFIVRVTFGGEQGLHEIWLFVDGPERILAWAASKNPQIDWEGRYMHHCQVCLALFQNPLIRETIADNYRERVDDVLMRYSVFSLDNRAKIIMGCKT
jgi:hypothetical protein